MARNKPKNYSVEVEDSGDAWINHLAIMLKTIRMMSEEEREATLTFVLTKYQPRVY